MPFFEYEDPEVTPEIEDAIAAERAKTEAAQAQLDDTQNSMSSRYTDQVDSILATPGPPAGQVLSDQLRAQIDQILGPEQAPTGRKYLDQARAMQREAVTSAAPYVLTPSAPTAPRQPDLGHAFSGGYNRPVPAGGGSLVATGASTEEERQALSHWGQMAVDAGLGGEGGRVLQAIIKTEGGWRGAVGDTDQSSIGSHGALQFFGTDTRPGQLNNFRNWLNQNGLQVDLAGAGKYARENQDVAVQWAIRNYLGNAIRDGMSQGLTGAELATYAQAHGQVSKSPELAGQNYNALFGSGQVAAQTTVDLETNRPQPPQPPESPSEAPSATPTADTPYQGNYPAVAPPPSPAPPNPPYSGPGAGTPFGAVVDLARDPNKPGIIQKPLDVLQFAGERVRDVAPTSIATRNLAGEEQIANESRDLFNTLETRLRSLGPDHPLTQAAEEAYNKKTAELRSEGVYNVAERNPSLLPSELASGLAQGAASLGVAGPSAGAPFFSWRNAASQVVDPYGAEFGGGVLRGGANVAERLRGVRDAPDWVGPITRTADEVAEAAARPGAPMPGRPPVTTAWTEPLTGAQPVDRSTDFVTPKLLGSERAAGAMMSADDLADMPLDDLKSLIKTNPDAIDEVLVNLPAGTRMWNAIKTDEIIPHWRLNKNEQDLTGSFVKRLDAKGKLDELQATLKNMRAVPEQAPIESQPPRTPPVQTTVETPVRRAPSSVSQQIPAEDWPASTGAPYVPPVPLSASATKQAVLNILDEELPTQLDDIIRSSKLPTQDVGAALWELESEGSIAEKGVNKYVRLVVRPDSLVNSVTGEPLPVSPSAEAAVKVRPPIRTQAAREADALTYNATVAGAKASDMRSNLALVDAGKAGMDPEDFFRQEILRRGSASNKPLKRGETWRSRWMAVLAREEAAAQDIVQSPGELLRKLAADTDGQDQLLTLGDAKPVGARLGDFEKVGSGKGKRVWQSTAKGMTGGQIKPISTYRLLQDAVGEQQRIKADVFARDIMSSVSEAPGEAPVAAPVKSAAIPPSAPKTPTTPETPPIDITAKFAPLEPESLLQKAVSPASEDVMAETLRRGALRKEVLDETGVTKLYSGIDPAIFKEFIPRTRPDLYHAAIGSLFGVGEYALTEEDPNDPNKRERDALMFAIVGAGIGTNILRRNTAAPKAKLLGGPDLIKQRPGKQAPAPFIRPLESGPSKLNPTAVNALDKSLESGFLTPEDHTALTDYITRIADYGHGALQQQAAVDRALHPPEGIPLGEWVKAVGYSSMLSGVRTIGVNALGSPLEIMRRLPAHVVRDTFGSITGRGGSDLRTTSAEIQGLMGGMAYGVEGLWKTAWYGGSAELRNARGATRSLDPYGLPTSGSAPRDINNLGKVLDFFPSILRATDEFTRQSSYGMALGRSAALKARDASSHIDDELFKRLMQNPSREMQTDAFDFANRVLYRGKFGEGIESALSLVDRYAVSSAVKYIAFPFFGVGTKIAQRGIEMTPIGLAGAVLDLKRGKYSGVRPEQLAPFGERIEQGVLGTVGLAAAFVWATQGGMTGGGPENPAERQDWERQGWKPWSFNLGPAGYWEFSNLGPLAYPLAIAAATAEAVREEQTTKRGAKDFERVIRDVNAEFPVEGVSGVGSGLSVIANAFQDAIRIADQMTFLQGVTTLSGLATAEGRDVGKLVMDMERRLFPLGGLMKTFGEAQDLYQRDLGQFMDNPLRAMQNQARAYAPNINIRSTLDPKLDPLGNPLKSDLQGPSAFISVRHRDAGMPNAILQVLHEHQVTPGTLDRTIGGKKLSDEQYRQYNYWGRKMAQNELLDVLNSNEFQMSPPDERKKLLTAAIRRGHQQIADLIVSEDEREFLSRGKFLEDSRRLAIPGMVR